MDEEERKEELQDAFSEFAAEYPRSALVLMTGLFLGMLEYSIKEQGGDERMGIKICGPGMREITVSAAHKLALSALSPHNHGESMMDNELLKCPNCSSNEVTVSHVQRFMANTGEHYCHVVKTQDADSEATCLKCQWTGRRYELIT